MFGVILFHRQVFPPSSCVIRVTAPQLSKFNTAIQLDQQLTAGDVVERFTSLSRSADGTRLISFYVYSTDDVSLWPNVLVAFIPN